MNPNENKGLFSSSYSLDMPVTRSIDVQALSSGFGASVDGGRYSKSTNTDSVSSYSSQSNFFSSSSVTSHSLFQSYLSPKPLINTTTDLAIPSFWSSSPPPAAPTSTTTTDTTLTSIPLPESVTQVPDYFDQWSSFLTHHKNILQTLVSSLQTQKEHRCDFEHLQDRNMIKGVLYENHASCTFRIQLFQYDDETYLIEFQRRSGCILAFNNFFRHIVDSIKSSVSRLYCNIGTQTEAHSCSDAASASASSASQPAPLPSLSNLTPASPCLPSCVTLDNPTLVSLCVMVQSAASDIQIEGLSALAALSSSVANQVRLGEHIRAKAEVAAAASNPSSGSESSLSSSSGSASGSKSGSVSGSSCSLLAALSQLCRAPYLDSEALRLVAVIISNLCQQPATHALIIQYLTPTMLHLLSVQHDNTSSSSSSSASTSSSSSSTSTSTMVKCRSTGTTQLLHAVNNASDSSSGSGSDQDNTSSTSTNKHLCCCRMRLKECKRRVLDSMKTLASTHAKELKRAIQAAQAQASSSSVSVSNPISASATASTSTSTSASTSSSISMDQLKQQLTQNGREVDSELAESLSALLNKLDL